MFCIVNSIDPLDLKEDDNDSDCSDSWELVDYDRELSTPTNENGNNSTNAKKKKKNDDETNNKKEKKDITTNKKLLVSSKEPTAIAGSISQQTNINNNNNSKKSKGQKQRSKVSFEIPDLVKQQEKQTIELTNNTITTSTDTITTTIITTKPKEAAIINKQLTGKKISGPTEVSSSRSKNNKKKQQDEVKKQNDIDGHNTNQKIDSTIVKESLSLTPKSNEPIKKAQAQQTYAAKAPVMNYAAALTAKLDINNCSSKIETLPKTDDDKLVIVQPKGIVAKRNRPISSSSWSSCDDDNIEEVSQIVGWKESEVDKEDAEEKIGQETKDVSEIKLDSMELSMMKGCNYDDGGLDSMVSSCFSECDYGFGKLMDYVIRPKKAQAKRRRNVSSTSSSLLTSLSKRGNEKMIAESSSAKKNDRSSVAAEVRDSKSKDPVVVGKQSSTSSRHIKPKKKRLFLSSNSNANQSDFLKRTPEHVVSSQMPSKKFSLLDSQTTPKNTESIKAEIIRVHKERQLMPPPAPTPSSSSSSIAPGSSTSNNDSSDIPDMDESWYLTPPPCFTGAAANKLCIIPKPKAKEAARENLLIEHPSIYIASTSKQVTVPSKKTTKESIPIKQRAIVLKKVSSGKHSSTMNNSSSSSSASQVKENEKSASKVTASMSNSKFQSRGKSWDNKFVVANLEIDEAYDNCFPALEDKPKSVSLKSKKSASKDKSKQQRIGQKDKGKKSEKVAKKSATAKISSSSTDGYESDFSIPSPSSSIEETTTVDDMAMPSDEESKDVTIIDSIAQENDQTDSSEPKKRRRNKSSSSDPKVPLKVEPIEPERQPGWQLKKRRSKRRPLVNSTVAVPTSSSASSCKQISTSTKNQVFNPYGELSYPGSSVECSARSTPTLINRIGSSIVANLSNLTTGFANSTGMNMQARGPLNEVTEKMNQIGSITNSECNGHNFKARKQMSKAFLKRQNSCLKVGSNSRPDRRTKMCTTPNGISVNRKVHANFH